MKGKILTVLFICLLCLCACQKEPTGATESPHEHMWPETYSEEPPTEKEEGARIYACLLCGETKETPIPRLTEEDYFVVRTLPTCEEGGTAVYTSEEWGEYEVSTPPLDHDYGSTPFSSTATCTENGFDVYVCSRCEKSREVERNAYGHDFVVLSVQEGSCLERGYTEYQCARCGEVYQAAFTDYVHDFVKGEYVPGSCTKKGYTPYVCRLCQKEEREETDYVHQYNKDTGRCDLCQTVCDHRFVDFACEVCGFSIREELNERSGIYSFGGKTYFGSYPQSHVSDKNILDALDELFEDGKKEHTYLGLTYVAVDVSVQQSRAGLEFSDGTSMSTAVSGRKIHYFRYDPIVWTEKNGLLIADVILDERVYCKNVESRGAVFYCKNTDIYANAWQTSGLREFLNGEFYERAFNDRQKALIEERSIDNSGGYYPVDDTMPWLTQEATTDRVSAAAFEDLYKQDDAVDEEDPALVKKLSDYAMCCDNVKVDDPDENTATWGMRSAGRFSGQICAIDSLGAMRTDLSVSALTGAVPVVRIAMAE